MNKVYVVISGGQIQNAYTNLPDIELVVIDDYVSDYPDEYDQEDLLRMDRRREQLDQDLQSGQVHMMPWAKI